MPTVTFDPPGFLADLSPEQKTAWHKFISDNMDSAAAGRTDHPNDAPRPQFFNSAKVEIGDGAATENVKWTAFPRIIQITAPSDRIRWKRADASRDGQDEYCEWSVTRDITTNKVTRVDFTSEGPEYWSYLAAVAPAKVLELYRSHVNPAVQQSDLFLPSGGYIARNRWNNSTSHGVMHLVQQNNTLSAEIEIAGAGSIQRLRPDNTLMTDAQELIACGRYGAPERNSDPFIGARVNFHARAKADITLANPVGIYFAGLDTQGWATPDGGPASDLWTYTRGSADRPVRAKLEAPVGKDYVLGDVKIDGHPIEFGGQVADRIQMTIRAVATRIGLNQAIPVKGCVGDAVADALGAVPPSVAAVLASRLVRGRV